MISKKEQEKEITVVPISCEKLNIIKFNFLTELISFLLFILLFLVSFIEHYVGSLLGLGLIWEVHINVKDLGYERVQLYYLKYQKVLS